MDENDRGGNDQDKHEVTRVEPAATPPEARAVLAKARRDHNEAQPDTPTGLGGAAIHHPEQQPRGEEDEAAG